MTWYGDVSEDCEVGVEESKMVAKMDENLTGCGVPDELTFSLYLPVNDLFHFESGGVEKDGSYGAHGFCAYAGWEALA